MQEKIRKIIHDIFENDAFDLAIPEHEAFGHYSTNVAMRMAKHEKKNPLVLAQELSKTIAHKAPAGFFEKVEAAAPGFVNFWLTPKTIQDGLREVMKKKEAYGTSTHGKGKTVIVEYSQPNIAKRLHAGHFRTTVIGDALANLFAALGYKVIRWNYLGDWGTQFGKVIVAYKLWGDEKKVKQQPLMALADLYVRFHDEAKKDPALDGRAQEEFKKLEEGDKENRRLWKWFKAESLKELDRVYKTLGVKFDLDLGESFFEPELKPLVSDLLSRGIAKVSEGAVVVPLEEKNLPPALIRKSDGASLYLTRDIANLRYRIKKYKPARILYVVGNEQALHFSQLFAVAEKLGFSQTKCVHVKYGLVLGEEGKKLATREGRAILLEEVLEKSIALASKIVKEKNPSLSAKEQANIGTVVGVGALKYNDLKENRISDITFHWEKMLDFTGNSGPYLQYTYARLQSIVRKAKSIKAPDLAMLTSPLELSLARKLFDFPGAVIGSADQYLTSTLATYLYELAALANKFYEATPILKDEDQKRKNARLALIHAVGMVLKRGLALLGIQTIERI